VPDSCWLTMRASECIRLELPLDARIRLLRDEYAHFESNVETLHREARLPCAALHGHDRIANGKSWLDRQWDELVERLLVEHYDPAYLRSIGRNFTRSGEAVALRLTSDKTESFRDAALTLQG
jgi:tRNA 2-selenouridine synthase